MKQYLYEYIEYTDFTIKVHKINDQLINEHLIKISFFQHERIINLWVTLTYVLLFFISLVVLRYIPIFKLIDLILCLFLISYVLHYFKLENGVQYLYKQYDLMKEKK